jgi:hypothetical protein
LTAGVLATVAAELPFTEHATALAATLARKPRRETIPDLLYRASVSGMIEALDVFNAAVDNFI